MIATEDWETVTIEGCCEILDNKRIPVNAEERELRIGNIPYYGANGLQGYIDAYIFDEPLILIAEDGGYFDEFATRPIAYKIFGKSWVNNHAHVLRAKNGYCQNAIFYALEHKDIQPFIVGGTRAKLNQSALRAITLNLPKSEKEQLQIATILSCLDHAIERTEAIIDKQQQIKTGLMQELLTKGIDENGVIRSAATHQLKDSPLGRIPVEWEVTNLGDIICKHGGKIQTGPFGSQLHAYEYVNEGIPVIMPQDVSSPGISTIKIARITEGRAKQLLRHNMLPGDLIFARRGDLSRCAWITEQQKGWICGTGCLLMRPPSKVLSPKWTAEIYRFHTTQLQVDVQAVGSTMPNLNTGILSALLVALPTYEEQVRIEEHLQAAEEYQNTMADQLTKLALQKTGLMHDLLTGTVRV